MGRALEALSAHSAWLALLAAILSVIAILWLIGLQKRVRTVTPDIRRMVRGMAGKRFDEVLQDLLGNMEFIGSRIGRLEAGLKELNRRQERAVQHVGLVRYNAEQGLGGDLSFALALLDAGHDGVIVTSVHTLSECRIYLRTVEDGKCAHGLNEEETAALEIALQRRPSEPAGASRLRRSRWRAREQARAERRRTPEKRGAANGE